MSDDLQTCLMSQPDNFPIEQSPSSTWGCTCCPVHCMTLVASPADEPDTQQDKVRWAPLLLSLHLSTFAAHLQESLVRQRGEVAKERTDAVHLMTQAEFDVKEMQESMQNSKRTQVSGGGLSHSVSYPQLRWTGPGSGCCGLCALSVVAAGCVSGCFAHDELQQGCQPCLDPHRPECQQTIQMGGTSKQLAHPCCADLQMLCLLPTGWLQTGSAAFCAS